MANSVHSVPVEWGRRRLIPPQDEDFGGSVDAMATSSNLGHHMHPPIIGSGGFFLGVGVVDSDEEMQPFDVESFVDRLVDDDPSPWRGDVSVEGTRIWEAPTASDKPMPGGINKSEIRHAANPSTAAKLFLQPFNYWPEKGPMASANGVERRRTHDMPIVVPHDPFLDALFTPARISSPEVAPTVTLGLAKIPSLGNNSGAGRGGPEIGIAGYEPTAIYNIPPVIEPFSSERQVPWAPARPDYGGFRMPSLGAKPFESAFEVRQQHQYHGTTHLETSNNILCIASDAGNATSGSIAASTSTATAPTRLIGADAFSEEYDDDRYAFLRQQEIALVVGPGYLIAPGKPGLVSIGERTALVDWLSKVHAEAPAASGGGPPLSLETLFLAVNLVDRFLSTHEGDLVAFEGGASLKVAGAACLGLASKYEDTQPTSLWGLTLAGTTSANHGPRTRKYGIIDGVEGANGIGNCGEEVTNNELHAARKEVSAMELRVLSALAYRLTVPTALSFLGVFIRRASLLGYLPEGPGAERVRDEAQQILLLVLRDAASLAHMPSALAAAALYWASCIATPGAAAPSSFAFFAVTGYQLESLCRCLRDMEAVRIGGMSRRGGGLGFGWAGAAFPEHAGSTLFGSGGGHPAIAAL